jgi:predicted phosphodiesterase
MIYKFSCIGLLLVGLASNFHLTSEETIAKSAEAEKESVTYLLGHMIVADPFSKLKLSDQEKKDLVRGFADGLSNPKENEELKKVQPEVNVFMREKMTELREEENKKRQDEMSKLAFPMDTEILGSDGKKHTLASLAKGKKAVLLDWPLC